MRHKKKKIRNFITNVMPNVYMGRSKFDLSYSHKTTMNVGQLCPVYIQEIYPGDTLSNDTTFVLRTLTPFIRPVMDSLFLDIYFFFVPNRLAYSRWNEVMGENVDGYWTQQDLGGLEVPKVRLPLANPDLGPAVGVGTVANYFGINIGQGLLPGATEAPADISDIPFRSFALIYNEWFRNQNFEAPVYVNTGDYSSVQFLNNSSWNVNNFHGKVPYVSKLADYFTSCLPEPQKGDAVDIPIGDAPVIASTSHGINTDLMTSESENLMQFAASDGNIWYNTNGTKFLGIAPKTSIYSSLHGFEADFSSVGQGYSPSNLWALNSMSIGNINDLRFAFQLQKMLERDARGGTRLREINLAHFGVMSPDARMQVPEFLGGKRIPLDFQEVAQTSQSTESSPLAQLSAYSVTLNHSGFSKGFVEHGFVIGVACVRQRHTYQQGIERFWRRFSRYDFYDPVFANIGEQPVYRHEIYAEALTEQQAEIPFGYNEAWADLRYRPARITGAINSTSGEGFDIWHFGDYYENAPVLNSQWIKETGAYVDRTLSAGSDTIPNFIVDFYHKARCARVMPLYSVPGLVDHH